MSWNWDAEGYSLKKNIYDHHTLYISFLPFVNYTPSLA